jgi:hypothetical protein
LVTGAVSLGVQVTLGVLVSVWVGAMN